MQLLVLASFSEHSQIVTLTSICLVVLKIVIEHKNVRIMQLVKKPDQQRITRVIQPHRSTSSWFITIAAFLINWSHLVTHCLASVIGKISNYSNNSPVTVTALLSSALYWGIPNSAANYRQSIIYCPVSPVSSSLRQHAIHFRTLAASGEAEKFT